MPTKNKSPYPIINTRYLILFTLLSCTSNNKKMLDTNSPTIVQNLDPHSFSHPDEAVITHLSLDLNVDFGKKILSGKATLNIKTSADAKEIILDSRDLNIEKVMADESQVSFQFGDSTPFMGKALIIPINKNTKSILQS